MAQVNKPNVLRADAPNAIARALDLLNRGEVVALPTDTVYGIAADGFNADAVEKLFLVKDRPSHKAIMLLIGEYADLERVATYVSPTAQRLALRFWPGGLTLVVNASDSLPANLRAQTNTIGVRLPDAYLVRELARALGRPLAATSANLSGGANPRTADDVVAGLGERIALVLDGGATPGNLPSTVLDCTIDPPRVLRAGAIPSDEIGRALGITLEFVES
jgi:L-threonylcarbamoyladenylate synthase